MLSINYIYIYIFDIFTKISFLTIQSIINIIKLISSYISKLKSSTDNIIKNNKKDNVHLDNTYYKKNKILNKCVCEYNMKHNQDCDWGWFVAIDEF